MHDLYGDVQSLINKIIILIRYQYDIDIFHIRKTIILDKKLTVNYTSKE